MRWRIPDLRILSLVYLAFPVLIFSWGWLRPVLAMIMTAMLALGCCLVEKEKESLVIRSSHLVWIILLTLTVAFLSGMGGFIPQEDDYLKHNQLWLDLLRYPWPIGYIYQGEEFILSYYLAYYLPPALLAKILGPSTLSFCSFLWGSMGIFLISLWGYKWGGKKPFVMLAVLLLFGGHDLMWRAVVEWKFFLTEGHWGTWNWDEMGLPYEAGLGHKLPTHFGALTWAPQHFLPGALGGSLILNDLYSRKGWIVLPFVQALVLLWSPFVGIGMGIFVLFVLWKRWKIWINGTRKLIPSVVVGLTIGIYFLAHQSVGEKGWIWEQSQDPLWPIYLVYFGVMKFFPLVFLLLGMRNPGANTKELVKLCALWLVLAMFYWMGHANDFYMRASIPAWFVLSLFLGKELVSWEGRSMRKWFLLLWFVGGSIIPFVKINNHRLAAMGRGVGFANTQAMPEKNFIQIKEIYTERGLIGKDKLWDQYVGDSHSFFVKYLSKPINIISTPDSSHASK